MPYCKSCKADIIWAKTRAGKNMPFDREPKQMWYLGKAIDRSETLIAKPMNVYVPHFATCPDADKFRKKG